MITAMKGESMDERRQLPRWEIKKEAKVWIPQNAGLQSLHYRGHAFKRDVRIF